MQSGFDEIKEAVKGKAPQTVYVEVSPLQYGLWSCGKNTFIQELIDIIGAKNIFADVEGWAAVSEEQVLAHNPDVILTTASPLTGIEDPVGEITSRANWGSLDAVKNKRVLMLDGDMISRPGPRLLDAAKELVKAVYPN
jgi:iron complex transport system substrate-binding protein